MRPQDEDDNSKPPERTSTPEAWTIRPDALRPACSDRSDGAYSSPALSQRLEQAHAEHPHRRRQRFVTAPSGRELKKQQTDLGIALERLRKCSTRYDEIVGLCGDEMKELLAEESLDEPEVHSRSDLEKWREWARLRAEAHADIRHPRMLVEGATGLDRLQHLPLFCSREELVSAIGVVPTLYFDFLQFAAGYCALGFFISLPSLAASLAECDDTYGSLSGSKALACAALGGRVSCASDACKLINLLVPILEVINAGLLLLGIRRFRKCAVEFNRAHLDANVLTEEYSVQLHGLPPRLSECKPQLVQAHLQTMLRAWSERQIEKLEHRIASHAPKQADVVEAMPELSAAERHAAVVAAAAHSAAERRLAKLRDLQRVQWWRVWDVTLIVNCSKLLHNADRQAPLEKKAVLIHRMLERLKELRAERPDEVPDERPDERRNERRKRAASKRIAKLEGSLKRTAASLLRVRRRIATKGFAQTQEVCGAFVTFEHQAAAVAVARILRGGLSWLRQPNYVRYPSAGPPAEAVAAVENHAAGEALEAAMVLQPAARLEGLRRLRAYPAPHPADVLHPNLPYRLRSLPNRRSWSTLGRRILGFLGILAALMLSVLGILVVTTYKNQAIASGTSYDESTAAALSFVASLLVVVCNIFVLILATVLGKFERHETVSGMHRSKVQIVTVSQFINLGLVALVVTSAVPPNWLTAIETEGWSCWRVPPGGGMCAADEYCCVFGPTGLLLRGSYLSMDTSWHVEVRRALHVQPSEGYAYLQPCQSSPRSHSPPSSLQVGSLIAYTMILQMFVASVAPVPFALLHCLQKRYTWQSKLTLPEMNALWTGPPIDLPKFFGKAFAFFAVTMAYSVVEPLLYVNGVLYFSLTWIVERWAMLRLHRTPPAYSISLIEETVWFVEWAVFLHLFFGFWAYANVPSDSIDGGPWTPPDSTLSVAVNTSTSANSTVTGLASLDSYNIRGHINSWGTLFMACGSLGLLSHLLLDLVLKYLSRVVPIPPSTAACAGAILGIMRDALHRARVATLPGTAPPLQPVVNEDGAAITEELELVGDPPFHCALKGVHLDDVRVCKGGRLVQKAQVASSAKRKWHQLVARFGPTSALFRLFRLAERAEDISIEQWEAATPKSAQLRGGSNISYLPEFSQMHEAAYAYMAPGHVLDAAVKDAVDEDTAS